MVMLVSKRVSGGMKSVFAVAVFPLAVSAKELFFKASEVLCCVFLCLSGGTNVMYFYYIAKANKSFTKSQCVDYEPQNWSPVHWGVSPH